MQTKIIQNALLPLSAIYYLAIKLRNFAYDNAIFKSHHLKSSVISIGNISTGGTGKTPTTIALANTLSSKGKSVCILSRGYRRSTRGTLLVSDGRKLLCKVHEAGDEPALMASRLKNIPILVDENRVRGGQYLIQHFQPDCILLDDGFQHRRLARDTDIVLLDPARFADGPIVLPAGQYREAGNSLKRAHKICLVKDNLTPDDLLKSCHEILVTKYGIDPGKIHTIIKNVSHLWDPATGISAPLENIYHQPVCLLTGIAAPERLYNALVHSGAQIASTHYAPDHFVYTEDAIKKIAGKFAGTDARQIITTMKDWVKLKEYAVARAMPFKIAELDVRLPDSLLS